MCRVSISKLGLLFVFVIILSSLAACRSESGSVSEAATAEPASDPVTTESATSDVTPASLVLRGGKVISVDPEIGDGQAIAVNEHLIMAVGTNDEISVFIGPDTEVIELEGRTVVPGLIEGHGHFLSLGMTRQNLELAETKTWNEIVSMVAGASAQAPEGAWISGFGWHQDKWDRAPESSVDGVPTNAALNAVAPNNPGLLTHASGHAAIANDAALAAAGIGDLTEDPDGGTIVRDANGKATGLLRETAQRPVGFALSLIHI